MVKPSDDLRVITLGRLCERCGEAREEVERARLALAQRPAKDPFWLR